MKNKYLLILGTALILSACKTTPEPIEAPVIEVELEPIQTCVPLELLTKTVIPAVTETRMTIVLIDNPPYEPMERREERTVVMEEARVAYIDAEGQEVIDICEEASATTEVMTGG